MSKTPKRLNYMTETEIDRAIDENTLTDNQIYYLTNQDEMKDYSKKYYQKNKTNLSLVQARRRAELKRRNTENYQSYQEQYRQQQREAFDALSIEDQNTITEMRKSERREYTQRKSLERKKAKQKQQLETLLELEQQYKK